MGKTRARTNGSLPTSDVARSMRQQGKACESNAALVEEGKASVLLVLTLLGTNCKCWKTERARDER